MTDADTATPTLKFKKRPDFVVWESDLSEFVSAIYGRPWRMQQGEMLGQNTYWNEEVTGTEPWEEGERQLAEWLALSHPGDGWEEVMYFERYNYLGREVVLWDLCRRGLIPAGSYQVQVWW